MSSTASTYETQFLSVVNNFIELFTDTISTAYKNGYTTLNAEMLKIAKMMLSKKIEGLGKTGVMDNFINKTNQHWEKIAEKDEKYFSANLHEIITDVPKDYVKEFSRLFTETKNGKSLIPKEDKEAFFDSATELVKTCVKYIYKRRDPKTVNGKIEYQTKYYPEISLTKYSKLFEIKLN
jgi:hypothetical protein